MASNGSGCSGQTVMPSQHYLCRQWEYRGGRGAFVASFSAPLLRPDKFFVSRKWLELSSGTARSTPTYYVKEDYVDTGICIGIHSWRLGLHSASTARSIRLGESIRAGMDRRADTPSVDHPIHSIFVGSDCGMHDSGCFVSESEGPKIIMDLFDPWREGLHAYAHASSYCAFLADTHYICDPRLMICPVCPYYGRFLGPLGRANLWWRRFAKVTMKVRRNVWEDPFVFATGVSEPGLRLTGYLDVWTDLLVVVVDIPRSRAYDGCSWNPDAEEWQWCDHNSGITLAVVEATVEAVLDTFDQCHHPNCIAHGQYQYRRQNPVACCTTRPYPSFLAWRCAGFCLGSFRVQQFISRSFLS